VSVALISLGCPKNLVDSERLLGSLPADRFAVCVDPADADVAVVNTCAFLESARTEAIETILEVAGLKTEGRLKGLVVTGCIVPRHGEELKRELPEVDAFVPFADYSLLPQICLKAAGQEPPASWRDCSSEDVLLPLTLPHSAYLKVAEGCNHTCSFCLIPSIRGKLISRPMDEILAEAQGRIEHGAVELNLIAQDVTDWGSDTHGERRLHVLLRELGRLDGVRWLRLLYAHPAHVTPELIREMAENERVVKYLDVPVQHASASVLRRMRRGMGKKRLLDLVARLRGGIPGLALRTTVLLGYPGETEDDVEELLEFLAAARFEHLGAFVFSAEEGTPAAEDPDQVPEDVREDRYHRVMTLQQEIAFARNRDLIGTEIETLVETSTAEAGAWIGRTYADAPEIDGTILIAGEELVPGQIGDVRVTAADGYDLQGTWLRKS
jgi:ribosomal protein S12 methylthiotransferase